MKQPTTQAYLQCGFCYRATQLTNHKVEREQYIRTFFTSANEMSSTEQWNVNLSTREACEASRDKV